MSEPNEVKDLTIVDQPEDHLPARVENALVADPYHGVALIPISHQESEQLAADANPDDLDILPTGEMYLSHVHVRSRLNRIIGVGQWALVPRGPFNKQGNTLTREYALIIRGQFAAESVGEADYYEKNSRTSYATVAEMVKSNALTRCAKDLSIGKECWDRQRANKWRGDYCVCVQGKDYEGKVKWQWRRKDAVRFKGELDGGDSGAPKEPQRKSASAQPADTPREPKDRDGDGPMSISGPIEDHSAKSGVTNGKPWERHGFQVAGQWFGTFDTTLADELIEAKEGHYEVEIEYEMNGNNRNITAARKL